jgi:hypothetical protein
MHPRYYLRHYTPHRASFISLSELCIAIRKSLSKRTGRFSDAETKLHSTRDKFIRPRDLTELRGYLCGNVEFALSSALDEDLLEQQYFSQRESIQTHTGNFAGKSTTARDSTFMTFQRC